MNERNLRLGGGAQAESSWCSDLAGFDSRMTGELVDFICVGPPRTGTTWLHNILAGSLSLPGPKVKETRFFDLHFKKGVAWYKSYFQLIAGAPVGEFGPTYFHSSQARQRIHQVAPNCKIICILREPVERLWSLYLLKLAHGKIRAPFEEAVWDDEEMFSSSRYSLHLSAWQAEFGAANVKVLFFDDLRENPARYITELCDFLDWPAPPLETSALAMKAHSSLDLHKPRRPRLASLGTNLFISLTLRNQTAVIDLVKRLGINEWLKGSSPAAPMADAETLGRVRRHFVSEVRAVEESLGVDLSRWLKPQNSV